MVECGQSVRRSHHPGDPSDTVAHTRNAAPVTPASGRPCPNPGPRSCPSYATTPHRGLRSACTTVDQHHRSPVQPLAAMEDETSEVIGRPGRFGRVRCTCFTPGALVAVNACLRTVCGTGTVFRRGKASSTGSFGTRAAANAGPSDRLRRWTGVLGGESVPAPALSGLAPR